MQRYTIIDKVITIDDRNVVSTDPVIVAEAHAIGIVEEDHITKIHVYIDGKAHEGWMLSWACTGVPVYQCPQDVIIFVPQGEYEDLTVRALRFVNNFGNYSYAEFYYDFDREKAVNAARHVIETTGETPVTRNHSVEVR